MGGLHLPSSSLIGVLVYTTDFDIYSDSIWTWLTPDSPLSKQLLNFGPHNFRCVYEYEGCMCLGDTVCRLVYSKTKKNNLLAMAYEELTDIYYGGYARECNTWKDNHFCVEALPPDLQQRVQAQLALLEI